MSDDRLSGLQPALASEQDQWLRRRFALYCLILTVASAMAAGVLAGGGLSRSPTALGFSLLCVLIYAASLGLALRGRRRLSRRGVLRLSYAVTLAFAAAFIVPSMELAQVITEALRADGQATASIGPMGPWYLGFLASHLLASLIIPWRPREAVIAYLPISLVMSVLTLAAMSDPLSIRIIGTASLLAVGLPGVAICAVRQSRFARRFHLTALSEYFEETTQELTSAQKLHEALLPAPIQSDRLSLEFAYEPMRAIGGDFLYVLERRVGGVRTVSCVLVDVTGHGIPAALTVHRVHGELERVYGGRPDADPATALSELNSYFHVALSKHSVFATALCLQILIPDGGGPARLRYASAGHPPAIHLSPGRRPAPLDATCFLLGAVGPEDFDPAPQEVDLAVGDSVVAYTDGAFECATPSGGMLGLGGLRAIIEGNTLVRGAADHILDAVRSARGGAAPNDDTLILVLHQGPSPVPGSRS